MHALGWVLTAALCWGVSSCGSSPGAICNAKCECEGCSDDDLQHCIAEEDGDAKAADFRGCPDLYSELAACESQTGVCDGTHWKTSCKDEQERLKHCID
jgi:hypothetical protein